MLFDKYYLEFYLDAWKMFGTPSDGQFPVQDMNELSSEVLKKDGVSDCYLSICDYKKGGINKVRSIPFDFDGKNGESSKELAKKEVRELGDSLLEKDITPFSILDSGNGFHLQLFVEPRQFLKGEMWMYQDILVDDFDFKTLDRAVFGQPNRLMRLPDTYNLSANQNCEVVYETSDCSLMDLPRFRVEEKKEFSREEIEVSGEYEGFPPYDCLCELIRQKEPSHLVRVFWVVLQQKMGESKEEVLGKIESFNWNDFDLNKTRYQIDYIYERELSLPRCSTLRKYDFCVESCDIR